MTDLDERRDAFRHRRRSNRAAITDRRFSRMTLQHPVTPDGRYFVVKGRLWRLADPSLPESEKSTLVAELMRARRAVRTAKQTGDNAEEAAAHRDVDTAKRSLGERGPVWWTDGDPDLNRHMVKNTPYASWFSGLKASRVKETA